MCSAGMLRSAPTPAIFGCPQQKDSVSNSNAMQGAQHCAGWAALTGSQPGTEINTVQVSADAKGKKHPRCSGRCLLEERGEWRYLSPLWRGRSQSWRSGVNLGGESHKCGPTAAGAEPEPPGAGWQLVHEHPPNHSMPQNRAPPNHSTPRAAGQLPGSEQNSLLGHCRRQKPSYTPIPHSNLGRKHLAPRSPTGQPCVPGLSPAEVTAPR